MQPARRVVTSTVRLRGPGGVSGVFTCRGCLTRTPPAQQRRGLSGSAPRNAAPPGLYPAGISELSSRKLISVSGPDAAKYLQGVITANLTPGYAGPNPTSEHLRSDAGFYAAFLTAQGRILHDVFIYRDVRDTAHPAGHSWLVEVDAAEADRLQKHIKRYKLRAKFDVRLLDEGEGRVWHAWDDANPSSLTTPQPSSSSNSSTTIITTPDNRAPNLGHRLLTFSLPTPTLPLPTLPETAYRLRRYQHGIAEGQTELLHNTALPHESNLDATGAVDFRKGCYVGQELTIRTEHRGVVRKRVLPCVLYPDVGTEGVVPEGVGFRADVGVEGVTAEMVPKEASIGRVGKKGRSAGKWLSGVGNLGLALCRLEIMTDVVLPGETGGTGFVEGDEFVVGLGGNGEEGGEGKKVRIKAFVPDWLRTALASKEGH
ncbi:putative transferase CAF17, mitochondrial [Chaetomium tenue]|uniref:Transferase CAF17, mitochondrial n=1 Tax=Chaetomium tenue TaxID=1854479 RepID=A0ACB7P5Y5_9PEZI|nr:putative transferase CAF17, mitochondrial [Chaetomium globosum]